MCNYYEYTVGTIVTAWPEIFAANSLKLSIYTKITEMWTVAFFVLLSKSLNDM